MPNPRDIVRDPEFQKLPLERRVALFSEADPDFGRLAQSDPARAARFLGELSDAEQGPLIRDDAGSFGEWIRDPRQLGYLHPDAEFPVERFREGLRTNINAPVARGLAGTVRTARGAVELLRQKPGDMPPEPERDLLGRPSPWEEAKYLGKVAARGIAQASQALGFSDAEVLKSASEGLAEANAQLEGYAAAHAPERVEGPEETYDYLRSQAVAQPPPGSQAGAALRAFQAIDPRDPRAAELGKRALLEGQRDVVRTATETRPELYPSLLARMGAPVAGVGRVVPTEGELDVPVLGPLVRGAVEAGATIPGLVGLSRGLGAIPAAGRFLRHGALPLYGALEQLGHGEGGDVAAGAASGAKIAVWMRAIGALPLTGPTGGATKALLGAMVAGPTLGAAARGEVPWDQAIADALIWGYFGYQTPYERVRRSFRPSEIEKGLHLTPEQREIRNRAFEALRLLRPQMAQYRQAEAKTGPRTSDLELDLALQERGLRPEPALVREAGRRLRGEGATIEEAAGAPPPEGVPRGTPPAGPPSPRPLTAPPEPGAPALEPPKVEATPPAEVPAGAPPGPPKPLSKAAVKRALIGARDKRDEKWKWTDLPNGVQIRHVDAFPRSRWEIISRDPVTGKQREDSAESLADAVRKVRAMDPTVLPGGQPVPDTVFGKLRNYEVTWPDGTKDIVGSTSPEAAKRSAEDWWKRLYERRGEPVPEGRRQAKSAKKAKPGAAWGQFAQGERAAGATQQEPNPLPETKAVGRDGLPVRLYHGTKETFSEFDPARARAGLYGDGLYFTTDPEVASGYARTKRADAATAAPQVRPVFVDIRNPFDADKIYDSSSPFVDKIAAKLDARGVDSDYWRERIERAEQEINLDGSVLYREATRAVNEDGVRLGSRAMNEILRELGFDGITHTGGELSGGKPHTVWIAFNEKQVRTALGAKFVKAESGKPEPGDPVWAQEKPAVFEQVRQQEAARAEAEAKIPREPMPPVAANPDRVIESAVVAPRTPEERAADAARVAKGEHPNSLDNAVSYSQYPPGPNYRPNLDFPRNAPGTKVPKARQLDFSRIIGRLARALKVPVNQGPVKSLWDPSKGKFYKVPPNYLGFQQRPRRPGFPKRIADAWINIRHWGDLQTAAHEIGHNLAAQFKGVEKFYFRSQPEIVAQIQTPRAQWTQEQKAWEEILKLSYTTDPNLIQSEGQAEFLRHWMTNPDYLNTKAPNARAVWEELLDANLQEVGPHAKYAAKITKEIRRAQKDMMRFYKTSAIDHIENMWRPQVEDPNDVFATNWDRLREVIIDDKAGAMVAEREIRGRITPDGLYEMTRNMAGVPDEVYGVFMNGAPKWVGKDVVYDGPSPVEFLMPVYRSKKLKTRFWEYVDAKQAAEIKAVGKEHPFTDNMIADGIALGRQHPEFEPAYRELVAFQERMADFGQRAGLWGPEGRARWRRGEYALGMFRHTTLGAAKKQPKFSAGEGALIGHSGVYQYRGSSRALKDPMVRFMEGYGRIIQMARENMVRQELERMLAEPGGLAFGRRIPAGVEQVKIPVSDVERQVRRMMKRAGIDMPKGTITDVADAERMIFYLGGKMPKAPNAVRVFHGDKVHYLEIREPMLLRAMASLRREGPQGWLKYASKWRKFHQSMVTSTPDFMLRNAIRDPILASITTRTGKQHFTAAARGYLSSLKKDPHYWEALANGGSGDAFHSGVRTPEHVEQWLIKKAQRRGLDPRGFTFLVNPLDWMRAYGRIGSAIEQGPRMGEYIRAREKGASRSHAAYLKAEVSSDFRMRGLDDGSMAARTFRMLADTTPFFNAMWVGSDKMIRNLSEKAGADPTAVGITGLKTGMFALMSLGLHIWNEGHPAYEEMEPWDKNANLHFVWKRGEDPSKDLILRMPTLWEVGLISNITRRWFEALSESPKPEDRTLAKAIRHYFTNIFFAGADTAMMGLKNFEVGLPGGVIGQGLWGLATGKDFYTDRPIEPRALEDADPWLRAHSRQGRTIRELARLWKDTGAPQVSPAVVQQTLQWLFSTWAFYGLALADRWQKGPAMHPDDLPLLRNLIERPFEYAKTPNEYYDILKEIHQAYRSMKVLEKQSETGTLFDESIATQARKDYEGYLESGAMAKARTIDPIDKTVNQYEALIRQRRMEVGRTPEERERLREDIWALTLRKLEAMEGGVRAAQQVDRDLEFTRKMNAEVDKLRARFREAEENRP